MKTRTLFTAAACCALSVPAFQANAQTETVVVEEQTIVSDVPCKTNYNVGKYDNWFIQFGAGTAVPFVEGRTDRGNRESHFTMNYNVGFGKWFSPYMGWRMSFYGGPLHFENKGMQKFNYVNGNLDFMWDMFNSLGGVNQDRVFSIVPFVGLGGAYTWGMGDDVNIDGRKGGLKKSSWTLPVSGGLMLRFRLCKYVDFFTEARAGFYGDNFNNLAYGRSLTTTAAALAAAEAQLPCPEVEETTTVVVNAPMMATVRFALNSAKISSMEMVNVYNTAQYLQANPDQTLAIVGYADKDTGTSAYNMALSKRRAQAVYDALVNKYGINPDRLTIVAQGSDSQPYDVNNWNRIVIFNAAE